MKNAGSLGRILSHEVYTGVFRYGRLIGSGGKNGKRALKSDGILLSASFKLKQILQMAWTSRIGRQKTIRAVAPGSLADLTTVKELVEAGKIKPSIDRCYPLTEAAEAHRYGEQGHKREKGCRVFQACRSGDEGSFAGPGFCCSAGAGERPSTRAGRSA